MQKKQGRARRRLVTALCLGAAVSGCGELEGSITLIFPNEVSRSVIRRLRVEAYSLDSGGTGLFERSCSSFLGAVGEGTPPRGTPVRGDYQCPEPCADGWFANQSLPKVPTGRHVIYVLAYASNEPEQTPILEGCTDRFDSDKDDGERDEVAIRLQFVVPPTARLVKVAGDRQVGRINETLGLPLEVEVRADAPAPMGGGQYVIPGVPITFRPLTEGYRLAEDGDTFPVGPDGRLAVRVQAASTFGTGQIEAFSTDLARIVSATASVTFSLSVTEPSVFREPEVIQQPGGRPVAIAIGQLEATPGQDLVLVTCDGSAEDCALAEIMSNPGATQVSVIRDVAFSSGRRALPVLPAQGILPTELRLVDMVEPAGVQEIAVLNARRADCQARTCEGDVRCSCVNLPPGEPCPCEGSEIRLLEVDGDSVELIERFTLTASNAVGMAVVPALAAGIDGLVIAARGRMRNERPCSRNNTCSRPNVTTDEALCLETPEQCGCPPNEFCECVDCSGEISTGFCEADDKRLDFLVSRSDRSGLYNRGGCQNWLSSCGGPGVSECACLDTDREASCNASDSCGCNVPAIIRLGEREAPSVPLSVAAGPLRPGQAIDLVVPSVGGLDFVQGLGRGDYEFRGTPIVNTPVHKAVVAQIDFAAERDNPELTTIPPDVAWIARGPCTDGFERACAVVDTNAEDEPRRGCMGVYFTDGQASVFRVQAPSLGGCRRHELTFRPDGLCVGQFNTDEHIDVAISGAEINEVQVFAGDGRGGLLDPPERFPLPDVGGGPLACADLDGDQRDDIAVFTTNAEGRMTGVVLLKTRP